MCDGVILTHMSTVLVTAPVAGAPADRPASPLAGLVAVTLAGASVLVNLAGYSLAYAPPGECTLEEIWRGTLLAVTSVGTAVPALACGLAGCAARAAPGRRLALLGLAMTAGFAAMFYALWT